MSRSVTEQPDKWVIIKMTPTKGDPWYKVFASWSGDYLGSDQWKMNSGITSVDSDDEYYYFSGQSGSCYKCHKNGYGVANSYSDSVLSNLIQNSYKINVTAEVLPPATNWETLNNWIFK